MNDFNKNALYLSKNSTDHITSVNLIGEKSNIIVRESFLNSSKNSELLTK